MMSEKLRVLAISVTYPNKFDPVKGIFIHNQLKKLANSGVGVVVVVPTPWSSPLFSFRPRWKKYLKIDKNAQVDGLEIKYPRYFRPPGFWYYPYSGRACYLGIRRTVKHIYKEFQFDIIYSNTLIPSGYAACLLGRDLGLPVVCNAIGSDVNLFANHSNSTLERTRYVIENSTRMITVCEYLRDQMLEIVPSKKFIDVIYRGIDIDVFRPMNNDSELKRKLKAPPASLVVTYVGFLNKMKGVYDLLKAFNLVADQLPQAYLLMIGYGTEMNNLVALSKKMGIEKRVIFTGVIRHEEIPSYYSITDVMAFPSYTEGLPNAVVEAMACGKPVVASKVGGIPEAIIDGINGFLIEVGDIKMLSSNIIRILRDKTLMKGMGQEGRRIAESHFNSRKNADKLRNLFRRVIQEHGSKSKSSI